MTQMKKVALIFLALALWLCPLTAGATTVDLYTSFPGSQGDNGFYVYKYDGSTYTLLTVNGTQFDDTGGYPILFKETSYPPWISMQPDYTTVDGQYGYGEDAVLAWTVPETNTYHISGSFRDEYYTSDLDITAYIKQNATILWNNGGNPIAGSTTAGFDLNETLNAGDILYFGVNPNGSNTCDWGGLSGTIEYTAAVVPLPGAGWLLSSGLIGLAVPRLRKRWGK
jgi:hypothetical protein